MPLAWYVHYGTGTDPPPSSILCGLQPDQQIVCGCHLCAWFALLALHPAYRLTLITCIQPESHTATLCPTAQRRKSDSGAFKYSPLVQEVSVTFKIASETQTRVACFPLQPLIRLCGEGYRIGCAGARERRSNPRNRLWCVLLL